MATTQSEGSTPSHPPITVGVSGAENAAKKRSGKKRSGVSSGTTSMTKEPTSNEQPKTVKEITMVLKQCCSQFDPQVVRQLMEFSYSEFIYTFS